MELDLLASVSIRILPQFHHAVQAIAALPHIRPPNSLPCELKMEEKLAHPLSSRQKLVKSAANSAGETSAILKTAQTYQRVKLGFVSKGV